MPDPGAKRYYTVEEANAQVFDLGQRFGRVMQLRGQLKRLYQKLAAAGHPPQDADGDADEPVPPELARDHALFFGMAEALRDEVESIMSAGCVIKDIESGLVDWPALHEGREIWLCWRYGEDAVRFWHELHGGFAGRRPVAELSPL